MKTTARFDLERRRQLRLLFTKERLAYLWRNLVKQQMRGFDITDLHDYYDFNFSIESRAEFIHYIRAENVHIADNDMTAIENVVRARADESVETPGVRDGGITQREAAEERVGIAHMVVDLDVELVAGEPLRRDPQIVARLRIGPAEIGRRQQTHGGYRSRVEQALRDDVPGQRCADRRAVRS